MSDPEVVLDDVDIDSEEPEDSHRRRWWGVLVAVLLLLLLLFCVATSAQVWVQGGSEQARFVARNLECLQCHTEKIPDFNKASVHNPFALKECTACHTPHGRKVTVTVTGGVGQVWRRYVTAIQWLPLKWWFALTAGEAGRTGETVGTGGDKTRTVELKGQESGLVMPETELCWLCHGSMGRKLQDEFVHQPFEAGRCTNCHDPHASDWRALINQPPQKLCLTCHPIGAELAREQVHPPVAQGWCIDCHDPHASNFKGMTPVSQTDLCFRCHPSVAGLSGMPVQHVPFINGSCTDCHEPHGADHRPLLTQGEPKLCYGCHPSISNQFAQASAHPVGVSLTCSSCHNPHAAQARGLISARDNSFCYDCHNDISVRYQKAQHKGQLCIKCHTPHGSPWSPMLRASNPDICFDCHRRSQYDESSARVRRNKHPVRPVHYDVNARKPLTCTSSCHNPHGSDKGKMLRYFGPWQDGGCLMCHAVTPGNRVAVDF